MRRQQARKAGFLRCSLAAWALHVPLQKALNARERLNVTPLQLDTCGPQDTKSSALLLSTCTLTPWPIRHADARARRTEFNSHLPHSILGVHAARTISNLHDLAPIDIALVVHNTKGRHR